MASVLTTPSLRPTDAPSLPGQTAGPDGLQQLAVWVLAAALLLGVGGLTGLYLTRRG